jgi:hypothetical protein
MLMPFEWARFRTSVATLLLCLPIPAQAKEFTVGLHATGDAADLNPGDGICASTAFSVCTLRAAIQEANAWPGSDTINVPEGHYTLSLPGINENSGATGDLDIAEDLRIVGAGAHLTTIDANGIDRVFDVLDGVDATLEKIAITGGNGSDQYWESRGGGIRAGDGSVLTLKSSKVEGNKAFLGAAIYGYQVEKATVLDTEVSHNLVLKDAGGLGGIVVGFYPVAGGSFQGFFIERTSIVDNRCVNTTGCATGLSLSHCSETLSVVRNSTISGNEGSGLSAYICEVILHHSTLYDNLGRGLLCNSPGTNAGLVSEVRNSILDSCQLQPGCFVTQGNHNQDGNNSCGLDASLGDLPGTDPMLQPLGAVEALYPYFAPTHHPRWTSPMIDSGTALGAASTDQESLERPWDGNMSGTSEYDIGALETLPCAGQVDASVTSTTFVEDSQIEGCRSVTSGAGVQVQNGTLSFLAREKIAIGNGFEVWVGAGFRASIVRWAEAG